MPSKPVAKKTRGMEDGPATLRRGKGVPGPTARSSTASAEPQKMSIYGSMPNDFLAISSTDYTLYCGLGEDSDEQKVLVPYLKIRFNKVNLDLNTDVDIDLNSSEIKFSSAFEGTVAFENLAFLLMDLARNLRGATTQMETMSGGQLKPEASRLRYSSACLKSAQASIANILSHLDEHSPAAGVGAGASAKPSAPRAQVTRPKTASPK